jgi:hypothetical protein
MLRWLFHSYLQDYVDQIVDKRFEERMYEKYWEQRSELIQERIQRLRKTIPHNTTQRVPTQAKEDLRKSGSVLEVARHPQPKLAKGTENEMNDLRAKLRGASNGVHKRI